VLPKKTTRTWFTWLRLLIAVLVLGGAFIGMRACPTGCTWGGKQPSRQRVSVIKVTDGDTIHVRDSRGVEIKVRLIGIDAPELGTAASFRSALYAAELVEGAREVWLEPDPGKPLDKYGRTLGWVFVVTPEGDELLLQEELIRAGLADLYRDAKGSKYYDRLERVR
jgi:endonuclease YncB( thermonuclease family)